MHENFFHKIKIYYEDTDSGGVVYYANYLKFLERARPEALFSIGFSNKKIKEQADLIAHQTSPAYADLTAKRAEFNELTIFDQVAKDTKLLNENQETLDKLNEKKKTLVELKEQGLKKYLICLFDLLIDLCLYLNFF